MFWTALAMLVASFIITAIFTPRTQQTIPQPASIDDVNVPQAEEGTPQCVVFGDCWVDAWTVLAYGNFRTTPIKISTKSGSKK